jgi:hypothetical protein
MGLTLCKYPKIRVNLYGYVPIEQKTVLTGQWIPSAMVNSGAQRGMA